MHPMAHSCGNYNNFVNVIITSSELNFKGKDSSEIKSTHCLRTQEHTSPGEPIGIYEAQNSSIASAQFCIAFT